MKFVITLFQDEDGVFIVECPSIPGCVSQGKTESEAEINIRQAIRECLEVRAEKGHIATLSVPKHPEVARGTLRSLIARADLTVDEFLNTLRG